MKRHIITALALAALTAGVVYAQHVTTDSDPAAPFATYKTYAWTPGTASFISLSEQRIHEGVNAQLQVADEAVRALPAGRRDEQVGGRSALTSGTVGAAPATAMANVNR